ncbi:hypothetical protein FOA52_005394 [Chlamydomonas sp. UWO 241]|nr:hypothetical protein FOA52_005394 [Chlamydomonas sp. UWO 241]
MQTGTVLAQNPASLNYFAQIAPYGDSSNGSSTLSMLFQLQPALLAELLECVGSGQEWQGIIPVLPGVLGCARASVDDEVTQVSMSTSLSQWHGGTIDAPGGDLTTVQEESTVYANDAGSEASRFLPSSESNAMRDTGTHAAIATGDWTEARAETPTTQAARDSLPPVARARSLNMHESLMRMGAGGGAVETSPASGDADMPQKRLLSMLNFAWPGRGTGVNDPGGSESVEGPGASRVNAPRSVSFSVGAAGTAHVRGISSGGHIITKGSPRVTPAATTRRISVQGGSATRLSAGQVSSNDHSSVPISRSYDGSRGRLVRQASGMSARTSSYSMVLSHGSISALAQGRSVGEHSQGSHYEASAAVDVPASRAPLALIHLGSFCSGDASPLGSPMGTRVGEPAGVATTRAPLGFPMGIGRGDTAGGASTRSAVDEFDGGGGGDSGGQRARSRLTRAELLRYPELHTTKSNDADGRRLGQVARLPWDSDSGGVGAQLLAMDAAWLHEQHFPWSSDLTSRELTSRQRNYSGSSVERSSLPTGAAFVIAASATLAANSLGGGSRRSLRSSSAAHYIPRLTAPEGGSAATMGFGASARRSSISFPANYLPRLSEEQEHVGPGSSASAVAHSMKHVRLAAEGGARREREADNPLGVTSDSNDPMLDSNDLGPGTRPMLGNAALVLPMHSSQGAPPSDGGSDTESVVCYHKVTARHVYDPDSGESAIVLIQIDVTDQKMMENVLQELARAQLTVLSQSFPRHIVEFFSQFGGESVPTHMGSLARFHKDVTIMFMDIVGFTAMSKDVGPHEVLTLVNDLFTRFDALCDVHAVQKVDTAGDSYIVASGVMTVDADGFNTIEWSESHDAVLCAHQVMALARDLLAASQEVLSPGGQEVQIRIGIHTGDCVSGLVGSRLPKFSLFGDTMNTASRMESTGAPGRIHVSESARSMLDGGGPDLPQYQWSVTGGVAIKGKGIMQSHLWVPDAANTSGGVPPALIRAASPRKQAHAPPPPPPTWQALSAVHEESNVGANAGATSRARMSTLGAGLWETVSVASSASASPLGNAVRSSFERAGGSAPLLHGAAPNSGSLSSSPPPSLSSNPGPLPRSRPEPGPERSPLSSGGSRFPSAEGASTSQRQRNNPDQGGGGVPPHQSASGALLDSLGGASSHSHGPSYGGAPGPHSATFALPHSRNGPLSHSQRQGQGYNDALSHQSARGTLRHSKSGSMPRSRETPSAEGLLSRTRSKERQLSSAERVTGAGPSSYPTQASLVLATMSVLHALTNPGRRSSDPAASSVDDRSTPARTCPLPSLSQDVQLQLHRLSSKDYL